MTELMKQDDLDKVRVKIQNFHNRLNKQPDPKKIVINQFAGNSKYLPISFLEMQLDEMFFGLWQTKNFKHSEIANEVVCSLELTYFHPSAQTWLTRVGVGAAMIQYKSKKNGGSGDITEIRDKIPNTLTKDFPHAKAQAFRNACLSIGKSFGRDLNRDYVDSYQPIIKPPVDFKSEQKKIIDGLEVYQGEDKEEIRQMCTDKIKSKEFDLKFAESIAKTIGVEL